MRSSILIFSILLLLCGAVSSAQFEANGTVLELSESNFDPAIAALDYVLVDFYAPWCGHCKRLAPELDAAAPLLSNLKRPIVVAKLNADKFTRLAHKYNIDGYPTLKLFMHGVPVEYNGPRKAELLVRFLKKFVAPDISVLESDSAISSFVEEAGSYFPIFIGFGLNESIVFNCAIKYKKKAWFSTALGFSEEIMVSYDFDKIPALVSIHPNYNEHSVFYGPFEESFLEEFIKQSLLPPAIPINSDTLKLLKDDERKIVLTIVEDENDENSIKLIKLLRTAAFSNRDLVFGYVGVKQWEEFADSFGNGKMQVPKMVVWNGNEEYVTVPGAESMAEEDMGSQINLFLEEYRRGNIVYKRIGGPSMLGFINSLLGLRTVYIVVFLVAVMILIQIINKEEPLMVGSRDEVGSDTTSAPRSEGAYQTGEKED